MAHHPVIQKQVDKLFATGTTKSSTGGAGYHSNLSLLTSGL